MKGNLIIKLHGAQRDRFISQVLDAILHFSQKLLAHSLDLENFLARNRVPVDKSAFGVFQFDKILNVSSLARFPR